MAFDLVGDLYEKVAVVSQELRNEALLRMNVRLGAHLIKTLNAKEMAHVKWLVLQGEASYSVVVLTQSKSTET